MQSNGLYYSSYSYRLVDDTPEFTQESAETLLNDNLAQIDRNIQRSVQSHVTLMHESGPMPEVNSYMPVDFTLPSDFTTAASMPAAAANDYVERILMSTPQQERADDIPVVMAQVSSSMSTAGRWQDVGSSYIAKQWNSGLVELYIHLPTTNTYYIPHIPGAGNCTASPQQITVEGKSIPAAIAGNETHI